MKKYGYFLREQRKLHNYTLAQIEQATGISNQNLSYWENDKRLPSIYFCELLADFYGISVDELIGRDTNYTEQDNYTQNNVHGNNTVHVTKNYNK